MYIKISFYFILLFISAISFFISSNIFNFLKIADKISSFSSGFSSINAIPKSFEYIIIAFLKLKFLIS